MRYPFACTLCAILLVGFLGPGSAAADLPPHQRPDCQRVFFPLAAGQTDAASATDIAASRRLLSEAAAALSHSDDLAASEVAYRKLWQAHHANPAEPNIRRVLGLPAEAHVTMTLRPGRAAPPILRWRRGRYLQCDTPHFSVHSQADRETTRAVAQQLERFYWIWTQVFFPLWQDRADVRRAVQGQGRIASGGRRMRVVLYRDHQAYVAGLREHVPGIERSTGFYSDRQQCTFLFAGQDADPATWQHELTHQLLREATRSRLRVQDRPGEATEFWLVEGIASYMESVRFAPTYALVGGWESPRMQFARYRWLAAGDRMTLAELVPLGRAEVQAREDIARWYAHSAAYAHLFMDGGMPEGRDRILAHLIQLYDVTRLPSEADVDAAALDVQAATERMPHFLRLDDARLYPPDPQIPLHSICLGHTRISPAALQRIPPQTQLRWLNLAGVPVNTQDVSRLLAETGQLDQLSLENTRIDDAIGNVLANATALTELDLSFTPIGDAAIENLSPAAPLETVYLTGTQVGEAAVKWLLRRDTVRQIDVQRTSVDAAALQTLREQHPQVHFNPLQLVQQ
ncbi:leucine-rich repeat domain-containing protein [Roseimaritima sediminicola]|uniref:hypothetical protein n=1 Tax=Roseimaritima sediminicola TaxID=2662066 RepID=UPI0012983CF3|nr:hypothetical protein [Roseimaritima sediminicola]